MPKKRLTLEEQRAELAQQKKEQAALAKRQDQDWQRMLNEIESRAITGRQAGDIFKNPNYKKQFLLSRKIRGPMGVTVLPQTLADETQEFQFKYPNRIDTFFTQPQEQNKPIVDERKQLFDSIFGNDSDDDKDDPDQKILDSLTKVSQAKVLAGTHKIVTKNGKRSIKKLGIRERQRNEKLRCGLYKTDSTGKLKKRTKKELEQLLQEKCN